MTDVVQPNILAESEFQYDWKRIVEATFGFIGFLGIRWKKQNG